ncbi:MAG: disulfide bond chaperone [Symploca sp. SIO2D2]|nr:disulfide bond chaperone [Symploca sp. SIO2D2]
MSEETPQEEDYFKIASCFVRGKNVLYAAARFEKLYVDYYLHLKDNGIDISSEHDDIFKRGLAAFALHCVSQPSNQTLAWTVNFQDPLINVFLGGDTSTGDIVGRIFTENVKEADENVFYQEVVRGKKPLRRSIVGFEGSDFLKAAEEYYLRSEQRPARFFELEDDTFAILTAHPDYDRDWFSSVTVDDVRVIATTEEISVLENRFLKWHCGCSMQRILEVLKPGWLQDKEELFLGEEMIEVNCPRCAMKYRVTREMMEAYIKNG